MAIIPGTKFAGGTPRASTGQVLLQPPEDGGGQQIAQGIEKMGAALFAYAINVQKKEMTAGFYEKRRQIDEAGWAAHEAMTGDDEADRKVQEKFQQDVEAIASSSKYKDVNEEVRQYRNRVLPNWMHGMRAKSLGIKSDNAEQQSEYEAQDLLSKGQWEEAVKIYQRSAALNPNKKAYYEKLIDEAPVVAKKWKVYNEAMTKSLEDGEKHILSSDLPTDMKREILSNLKFEKELSRAEIKKKQEEVNQEYMKLLISGDYEGAKEVIKKNVELLGTDWMQDELNKLQNASRILADGGPNPYTKTQNWTIFEDDKVKALAQKLTEDDIRKHTGPNGYSDPEANRLREIIKGNATGKDFEDSKAAKHIKELIGASTIDDELKPAIREKGYRLLSDAISSSEKPLNDRQKTELALKIFVELEKESQSIFDISEIEYPKGKEGEPAVIPFVAKPIGVYKDKEKIILNDYGFRWMIRATGSRDPEVLREFAKKHNMVISD